MRVLLVSANRERIPDPIFPLGLAYVAAAARHAGYEIAVADLCFGMHPLDDLRRQVGAFRPDVVGLSIRNIDNAAYPLTVEYLDRHREVVETLRAEVLQRAGLDMTKPDPYRELPAITKAILWFP